MLHRFAMAIVYHVTTLKRKPQFSLFYFSPLTFPFFPALRFIFPSLPLHFPLALLWISPAPLRIFPTPLRISLRPVLRFPVLLFCLTISLRPSPFLLPMPCACPPCRRARREGFAPARSGASAAGLAAPWAEERVRAAKRRAFCPPSGRLKYGRVRAGKSTGNRRNGNAAAGPMAKRAGGGRRCGGSGTRP